MWRAQAGHDDREYYQDGIYIDDFPVPYSENRMRPLLNSASEGRANPKGIPCLYVASTKETAMSEIRPWLG
ncbi:RES domain-containing protein, partial [Vibrio vulnificus]